MRCSSGAASTQAANGRAGKSEALHRQRYPGAVFVCASAVGYYGFRDGTPLDESAATGSDFLDQVGLIMLALEDERVRGPLNATAPEPQANRDFSQTLGKVMWRPAWVPVPGIVLRAPFGEVAGMLNKG